MLICQSRIPSILDAFVLDCSAWYTVSAKVQVLNSRHCHVIRWARLVDYGNEVVCQPAIGDSGICKVPQHSMLLNGMRGHDYFWNTMSGIEFSHVVWFQSAKRSLVLAWRQFLGFDFWETGLNSARNRSTSRWGYCFFGYYFLHILNTEKITKWVLSFFQKNFANFEMLKLLDSCT